MIKGEIMLNFKDFINDNKEEAITEDKMEQAKKTIEKYSSMSESELTTQIAKTIKEQKGSNSFDKERVLGQIESMSAFLSPEQKDNMIKLLNELS